MVESSQYITHEFFVEGRKFLVGYRLNVRRRDGEINRGVEVRFVEPDGYSITRTVDISDRWEEALKPENWEGILTSYEKEAMWLRPTLSRREVREGFKDCYRTFSEYLALQSQQ